MENVASCSPTTFSIQIFLFFSKFRLSFFNDGGLKRSHFDIFGMLSPCLAFVKLYPIVL